MRSNEAAITALLKVLELGDVPVTEEVFLVDYQDGMKIIRKGKLDGRSIAARMSAQPSPRPAAPAPPPPPMPDAAPAPAATPACSPPSPPEAGTNGGA